MNIHNYDDLKAKLLDKVGLSRRDLEIKLFCDLEEDTRSMDRYNHIKQLADRVGMMCATKDDLLLFVVKGLFRRNLPLAEQGLIDGRMIKSFKDLSEVATTLKACNTKPRDQSRAGRREWYGEVKCFKCGGVGHKSFDCRGRREDGLSKIVCYSCNEVGHKSPDCPKRVDKVPSRDNKSSETTQRNLVLNQDLDLELLIGWPLHLIFH